MNNPLNTLKRGLQLLISRGVVNIVNDTLKQQNLQVSLHADDVADDVERFQNYGISSVPPAGSEAIVLSVGGKREHLVAICVGDKKSRIGNLQAGDSVLYHLEGHKILLTKEGVIQIVCKRLEVKAETEVVFDTPQTTFTGKTITIGSSTANDHLSNGKSGANHTHSEHDGPSTSTPK